MPKFDIKETTRRRKEALIAQPKLKEDDVDAKFACKVEKKSQKGRLPSKKREQATSKKEHDKSEPVYVDIPKLA